MNNYKHKNLYSFSGEENYLSMYAYSVYLRSGGDAITGRFQITIDTVPEWEADGSTHVSVYWAKLEKWTDKGFVLVSSYRFDITNHNISDIEHLLASHFESFTLGTYVDGAVSNPVDTKPKKTKKPNKSNEIKKLADKYIKNVNKSKNKKYFDFL